MKNILSIMGLCLALALVGNASVITGSNIVLGEGLLGFGDHSLTIYQNEEGTNPTSIGFDVLGSVLSVVDYNIDEGSDWFLTSYNNSFSEETIGNDDFPIWLKHDPTAEINDIDPGYGDFYLGVSTSTPAGWMAGVRDVFGWVQLRNTGGTLEMIDNAVAYGGTGIYIGTTTQIPEPSTLAFIGVFGGGLWFLRRYFPTV